MECSAKLELYSTFFGGVKGGCLNLIIQCLKGKGDVRGTAPASESVKKKQDQALSCSLHTSNICWLLPASPDTDLSLPLLSGQNPTLNYADHTAVR